jgi:hypothetical protein
VSRKILREHGGDIFVTSVPEKGSRFTLEFPLKVSDDTPSEDGRPVAEEGGDPESDPEADGPTFEGPAADGRQA